MSAPAVAFLPAPGLTYGDAVKLVYEELRPYFPVGFSCDFIAREIIRDLWPAEDPIPEAKP